jgi:hypothetical protein
MRTRASLSIILCLGIVVISAGPALAAENPSAAEHADHHAGVVNFPISCSSDAQTKFNGAITLLHHMTYPEARKAFEQVTKIDPSCSMAHWGIAMTLFQPLWPTRPSSGDLERRIFRSSGVSSKYRQSGIVPAVVEKVRDVRGCTHV